MLKTDFYYELPPKLIAQTPIKDRASSKLLTLDKLSGRVDHKIFSDITGFLEPGDCLVINDTKVIPARLIGLRKGTGAKVEVFLLKPLEDDKWEVLVKPGKKARPGEVIVFGGGLLECEILDIAQDGKRIVKFAFEGVFNEILDEIGEMPLPPYIEEKLEDKNRYQTVYAAHDGSVAAPTAGLHFSQELLNDIKAKGVNITSITLHVGLGTFRPVKADNILDHHMHSEYYDISKTSANTINQAKEKGKKVIAVGTTSCRSLEACANDKGLITAGSGNTDIFIYPGYKFKIVDALITNFHLPESTLLMLVSAMAGRENILNAYKEAIALEYRFFSFGDAMFIH